MLFATWGEVVAQSLQDVWFGFIQTVPLILIAIIIFAIGWVFSSIVFRAINHLFKAIKLDEALVAAGFGDAVKRAGYTLNTGKFFGELVRWFIVVVFLVASLNLLGLTDVNNFLKDVVLSYLPQVIIAVLMLLVAVVVAGTAEKFVVAGAKAAHVAHAQLLGSVTKWSISVFAVLTVLYQLGIAAPIIQTLITGVVFALALAGGLSFGLGGKEAARDMIEKIKGDIAPRD
ncbi:MAG: hypothetical protein Q7R78_02290 [bacterium]|nr:hypothetical protein [bacterium]